MKTVRFFPKTLTNSRTREKSLQLFYCELTSEGGFAGLSLLVSWSLKLFVIFFFFVFFFLLALSAESVGPVACLGALRNRVELRSSRD
jgi:hypothetical protein